VAVGGGGEKGERWVSEGGGGLMAKGGKKRTFDGPLEIFLGKGVPGGLFRL